MSLLLACGLISVQTVSNDCVCFEMFKRVNMIKVFELFEMIETFDMFDVVVFEHMCV